MYEALCALLMAAGLAANLRDRRNLALVVLLGVVFFVPTPREYGAFYLYCASAEIVVALLAVFVIKSRASELVAYACALLVISHFMGYSLDGNPPFSPYRGIVKLLEISQLVACVALSPALAHILRNRDATTS